MKDVWIKGFLPIGRGDVCSVFGGSIAEFVNRS
jgi:hypothetical protein